MENQETPKEQESTFIITHDGGWTDIGEKELHKIFEGVYNYCEDSEIDNLQWDKLNFNVFDEDWYRDKYGEGFPDEWYALMAESTKEDNKVVDYRQHSLKIEEKEIILKFD